MSDSHEHRYELASHVYACRIGEEMVLLDVKRDLYVGVDASSVNVLVKHVAGLPRITTDMGSIADSSENESVELLKEMLGAGMLVRKSSNSNVGVSGDKRDETPFEHPEYSLIEGYASTTAEIRVRDVVNYTLAFFAALMMFRGLSFERIIRRLQNSVVASRSWNLEDVRRQVAVIRRLRPILYTSHDACVFHSLVMYQYLRRYETYPKFVFGVRAAPFGAHCWLQIKNYVIDDSPEYVREFVPIAVI